MAEFRENKDVRRPFLSTPDSRVYFPASTIEKARRAVARCLRRGEGVAVVVGATGTGKTLLARTLASEFENDNLVSVVSVSRKLDVKSFLQQFMFGLRQSYCGCDETEMRLMTLDYLERSHSEKCVMLVDDAHNLSLRVFDEIRALVDQTAAIPKQLSVCLFGSNALEERLNVPALYPFEQRIVARAYLDVFTRDETRKYIDKELSRSKIGATFTKSAKDEVAKLSGGVPRVVAQLCDRALFLASDGQLDALDDLDDVQLAARRARKTTSSITVDVPEIERAWNNLQNIPDESEEPAPIVSDESPSIEFGELTDEDDEISPEETVDAAPQTPSDAEEIGEDVEEEPVAESVDKDVDFSSELSEDEDVQTTTEETANAEPVVDWEAERYGSAESSSGGREEIAEVDEEPESEEEPEVDEARPVEPAPLTQEERRSEAKRAFWNQDGSTVFVASLDRTTGENAQEPVDEKENAAEEAEKPSSLGYEIDEALDARLREKFGFTIDSFESETEDAEMNENDDNQKNASSNSYDVYSDGMKFEIRGASEPVEERASAETNAPNVDGAFDIPAEESGYEFDASMEMSAQSSGVAFVDNPKSSTRKPIVDGNDGSKEYREFNGFDAEDASTLAADDSNVAPRYAAQPEPGETAPSLADRAYSQIVAASGRGTADATEPTKEESGDRYLDELDMLEKEIAEEADLIRRIRNIHMQLRAATSSAPQENPDQDQSDTV